MNYAIINVAQPIMYISGIICIVLAILFKVGYIKKEYEDKTNLFVFLNLGMAIFSFVFGHNLEAIFNWALPRIENIIRIMVVTTVILSLIGNTAFKIIKSKTKANTEGDKH